MTLKHILFLGMALVIGSFCTSAEASLYVCQKGKCDYADGDLSLKPWIRQLHPFFKTQNARIDFCEADPKTRTCLSTGLHWVARSKAMSINFAIPVARTLPQKKTLTIDYFVTANASLPSCSFSPTTFEEADNKTIRIVSHAFDCQISGLSRTKLQNTFFVDYIDFDNAVIGAQYAIQTHGETSSNAVGYTLMKFRDGNTLLPLVPQPYYGEMPEPPNSEQTRKMAIANAPPQPEKEPMDKFVDGVKDWWQELKESFNLDKPKRRTAPNEEPHWWQKFSDNFMKVFYLEPLE